MPRAIRLPEKEKAPPKAMVRRFESAIARTAKKSLDLNELRDEYSRALLKLAEKKHAQRKDVVGTHSKKSRPEKVVDLMEVLKRSLKRAA